MQNNQRSNMNRPALNQVRTSYNNRRRRKKSRVKVILSFIAKALALVFTLVFFVAVTLFVSLGMMFSDNNPYTQKILVPSLKETGNFAFLSSWFLPDEKIREIEGMNSMEDIKTEVNTSLITVGKFESDGIVKDSIYRSNDPIEIHEISSSTYYGTMMIVKDPSRVSLGTIYPWREVGVTLEELVKSSEAIGGINGGLYNSTNNTGGKPYGVIVSGGEIQMNEPKSWPGLVLVGLTNDNILQIIDISDMGPDDITNLVAEKGIRDAVTFQDEINDANNHFVQLIINGEERGLNGMGSGLNPRTAIGQRADGALLLFVTDGRGKSGHLGASALDLITIMKEYGAVNAANLDGGSSSCMYYDNEYLMTSVTLYYSNSSWKLPAGFIVK